MVKKLSKKREKQLRKTYQHEKPTPDQLLASGDIEPLVSQTAFLAAWQAVDALKKARREAGLSLSQVATRGGWIRRRSAGWRPANTSTPPSILSVAMPLLWAVG